VPQIFNNWPITRKIDFIKPLLISYMMFYQSYRCVSSRIRCFVWREDDLYERTVQLSETFDFILIIIYLCNDWFFIDFLCFSLKNAPTRYYSVICSWDKQLLIILSKFSQLSHCQMFVESRKVEVDKQNGQV